MTEYLDVRLILGKRISLVTRVAYVFQGLTKEDGGPLELTLSDGSSVVFDAGPDGESLIARAGPWADPFREPLSEVNRAFIERSGKWTAVVVSDRPPYAILVGRRIVAIDEVALPNGKISDARLVLDQGYLLRIFTGADELHVSIEPHEFDS